MQKPSDNWRRIRRAAIERCHGAVLAPFTILLQLYLAASTVYLAGFIHLNFLDSSPHFSGAEMAMVAFAALSGLLVPTFFSSAAALALVESRLRVMANE